MTVTDVNEIAREKGYVKVTSLSTYAMPIKEKGMVNTMRVSEIESKLYYIRNRLVRN
jgi:pyruvate kinase